MVPEDGILPERDSGLDAATFLPDPAVELTVADRKVTQLVERAGRLRIGELGHEPEAPFPHPERVLHPGLQPERLVDGHDLASAGQAAIAAAGQRDLARERDEVAPCSTVGLQDAAATDVAPGHRQARLERRQQGLPQSLLDHREAGAHRTLQ